LPVLLLIVLLVRGVTLEGSTEGLRYYTTPNWESLSDMAIWQNAATQAVYSVSIALGNHMVFASYNNFNNNLIRDGLILGITNSLVSIFGGFIVFMFLGHASLVMNRPIDKFEDNGPGLIFFAYIRGMTHLPASAVWCFLFFMMVFTLGLDSLFGHLWSMFGSLSDAFPNLFRRHPKLSMLIACIFLYCLGLPLTTKGGIHLMAVMDTYAVQISRLICIFMECIAICWIYGIHRFMQDIEMMIGADPFTCVFLKFMRLTWQVTAPAFSLVSITCSSFHTLFVWNFCQD